MSGEPKIKENGNGEDTMKKKRKQETDIDGRRERSGCQRTEKARKTSGEHARAPFSLQLQRYIYIYIYADSLPIMSKKAGEQGLENKG